ncbi:MAG: hypothetical protein J6L90_07015 [Clostridia bacterium]|nr:hypothetical protein [Clostridia bacterium]
MFFRKRKNNLQRVMCREPFIAAFSDKPFYEAQDGAAFPDFVFCEYDGHFWCVRIGEFEILWGFGDRQLGFGANGSVILKRHNMNAATFDMKGIPTTRVGEISYMFINRITDRGREGFAKYLEPRLLPHIVDIARRSGADDFKTALAEELPRCEALSEMLAEHGIELMSATVKSVIVYSE